MTFSSVLFVAMSLLAVWAVTNITLARAKRRTEPKGTNKYFYWEMNGLWNIVNLAIAIASLAVWGFKSEFLYTSITAQIVISFVVLINVLLDFSYILIGWWMRSRKAHTPRQYGYGTSLILQGSFLLVFDAVLSQILLAVALGNLD